MKTKLYVLLPVSKVDVSGIRSLVCCVIALFL